MVQDGCSGSLHHVHIHPAEIEKREIWKKEHAYLFLKHWQRNNTQTFGSHPIGQNLVKQPK